MKLSSIKMPQAKPTVNELTPGIGAVTPLRELTQLTISTGVVCKFEETANVAPVSLTLLVKTIIAPERMEYFVRGSTIDLKTVRGFAPNVLEASSISTLIAPLLQTWILQNRGRLWLSGQRRAGEKPVYLGLLARKTLKKRLRRLKVQ